jgi:hypothetical protein
MIWNNRLEFDLRFLSIIFFLYYTSLSAENNVLINNKTLIAIYVNNFVLIDFDMIVIKILKQILRDRFEIFDFNFCLYHLSMMIIRDRKTRKLILN